MDLEVFELIEATSSPSKLMAIVKADWPKWRQSHAAPYIGAIGMLSKIGEPYGADFAGEVELRFLCNAAGWRGPVARALKARLKVLLREAGVRA